MNTSPLVSIIIVNWNGGEVFKDCLKTLELLKYPNWELIVVDNGSSDGSDNFKFSKTRLKIIRNKSNLGFALANNIGYKSSKGEYVLFLNNDTRVKPDFLTKLVDRIESQPDLAVIQPKIYFMDSPDRLDNVGSFLTWTGFLTHVGFGEKDSVKFENELEVFSAKGACMLVRRSVIKKVGLFDSDFVSYFEESDFCWRVWLAGYRVLYYPKTSILHKVGFSSKKLIPTDVNYHSFKNRIASLYKNLGTLELFRIFVFHIMLINLLSLYFLFSLKISQFWMVQKAIFWNIKNIERLSAKRKKIQNFRVISDGELFKRVLRKFYFKEMFLNFIRIQKDLAAKKTI